MALFSKDLRGHWDRKRANTAKIKAEGRIVIAQVEGRLQVTCPYHPDFPHKARELNGRYRGRSGVWTFPIDKTMEVLNALLFVFGSGKLPAQWEQTRVNLVQRYLRGGE